MTWSVVPYQSTHNTGGAVMGTDPRHSALNRYLQSWDVSNVFVTGASAFPHNSGYNPTGPVGALAYWMADAIREQISQEPGAADLMLSRYTCAGSPPAVATIPLAAAAQDAQRGKALFEQCVACHSFDPATTRPGRISRACSAARRRASATSSTRRRCAAPISSGRRSCSTNSSPSRRRRRSAATACRSPACRTRKARADLIAYLKQATRNTALPQRMALA